MVYVFSIFDRFINERCMFFSLIICGFVYPFGFFLLISFCLYLEFFALFCSGIGIPEMHKIQVMLYSVSDLTMFSSLSHSCFR